MPQIEQVQVVHWGALRPDPIDLAVDGISVAIGPNGAGKTTFLDAIKLILGAPELKQTPKEYVYHGDESGQAAAVRALIKVTFSNPERPGRQGRVFAIAGRGCESQPHVSAICEVSKEGSPRFAILPGYLPWGMERTLEEDLQDLSRAVPRSHWLGMQAWRKLMSRVGVSPALAKIISIEQGEASKLIDAKKSPAELLRSILDITGRRKTLEDFNEAKSKLAAERTNYERSRRQLHTEEKYLESLAIKVRLHENYKSELERKRRIELVELPVARRRLLEAEHFQAGRELDATKEQMDDIEAQLGQLSGEIPKLKGEYQELVSASEKLRARISQARTTLSATSVRHGKAENALTQAEDVLHRAGETSLERVEAAEGQAIGAEADLREALSQRDRTEEEVGILSTGEPLVPDELRAFRVTLSDARINSELLAEKLEVEDQQTAAEAVLSDGAWTLIVEADHFEQALQLATEHGYRLPVAAAGEGNPAGVLKEATGLLKSGAYLEEIDLHIGVPGVSPSGVVRGRTWGQFRAPKALVLGADARRKAMRDLERRHEQLKDEILRLQGKATDLRARATLGRRALDAQRDLAMLKQEFDESASALERAQRAAAEADEQNEKLGPEVGRLERDIENLQKRKSELEAVLEARRAEMPGRERRLAETERQLAELPALDEEQESVPQDLPPVESLERELADVEERLQSEARFPEEVRSQAVVATYRNQEKSVEELKRLVGEREDDVTKLLEQVDKQRAAFHLHIRELINTLNRYFRDVCKHASVRGELKLIPIGEEEFGLDVQAAHNPGDPLKSYKSKAHSAGQRAKLSILLLLAALSLDGSADLLIMDEHAAHLDTVNTRYIAEAMTALKDRVQFILAAPSDADSTHLWWCDHQLGFLPKVGGEPFVPPIKVITKLSEERRRYLNMGQTSFVES